MGHRRLILATCLLAACSGSETTDDSGGGTGGSAGSGGSSSGGGEVTLSGTVNVSTLPAGAKVVVIWSVSSSSPDSAAKFGEGTVDGSSFTVTFSGPPPTEALNEWGSGHVGVGYPVVVPASLQLPDGVIAEDDMSALDGQMLALNTRQMILWRSGTVEDPAWASSFAEGSFSCGQCVDATESVFDSIAPVSCEELTLWPPELVENSCNWT